MARDSCFEAHHVLLNPSIGRGGISVATSLVSLLGRAVGKGMTSTRQSGSVGGVVSTTVGIDRDVEAYLGDLYNGFVFGFIDGAHPCGQA